MEVGLTTKVNLFEGLVSERSTRYCYWFQEQSEGVWLSPVKLPDGDWQFAFASPLSPTEIEAEEWVQKESRIEVVDYNAGGGGRITITSCKDYEALENGYEYDLDAIESLHSRIKSEGFPHPERVVLLTKK